MKIQRGYLNVSQIFGGGGVLVFDRSSGPIPPHPLVINNERSLSPVNFKTFPYNNIEMSKNETRHMAKQKYCLKTSEIP